MAEVKWIKITTDIFDDEKIALIESMPEADGIIVVWFKLLCMAGKQNNGGVFMLNNKIAYTDEMLATIFRRPLNTVRLALNTFEQFEMISVVNNAYTIPNWEKHQSLDKMEQAKEQTRQRVARHREKQKLLAECNGYSSVTVTQCNADRIEEDKDKEEDRDKRVDCQQVVDLYHSICKSFPKVRTVTDARKKAIKARLNTYSIDDFKTVFTNAENSAFLKGSNNRNWTATFDWLIKDGNMAKVLEGNYADKGKGKKEIVPDWMKESHEQINTYDDYLYESIRKKTVADDDEIRARAEALKKELGGT